ncbi:excalibur calcium-binding domain-containing protein [Variovorax sp. J22G21]|uniref:excalibur calcium-binding domain-containing protein n=1 Tax=Variovorax fucosicus TaxID=3053517 RepID=UPI002577D060|nr:MULTISPECIES: excalibur calcium-binding domain-containing protein [unclassified Variovorax]MDM0041452.1 excalibur calcium-binding domain-containing protein [Variovorax sp. J22R193]MDM0057815.1 excalibur calcium-binding domain-containing protein [Variovorax sp. J22G47]MDM0060508.1 excalibur calcium-binding domain-containing protein [Variovorax sp. J22G21]
MKQVIIIAIVAVLAWQGYSRYQERAASTSKTPRKAWSPSAQPNTATAETFRCDGRTHCSQMTSCAEATYFLKNCPGTKMDGNNDGVPCEQQWCR